MIEIKIKPQEKSYPIIIENEAITDLREKVFANLESYLVVISAKVEKLYGRKLNIPKERKFILKDGEKEKNFTNYRKILEQALKLKLTRKSTIVAIGGGVVGDLAGFCASTYMRGIDFIQVPTTLLACVDSSVGGKTAIDTSFGKNLIGTFYQPKAVYINPRFLKNLTNFLSTEDIHDEKVLAKLIEICIKLKKSVVEKDEKESGLRRILNFGHTYGHAVEKITNYKKFTHGEAVVEGMRFAFELALKKNLIDKTDAYGQKIRWQNHNFYTADRLFNR